MKILFIFTGGTIGSTLEGGVISADKGKAYKILEAYSKKYGIDFDYDVSEPYTELSENNTGEQIRMLLEAVKANITSGYDGIVVTHGTDTLQYSAAALGYAIGNDTPPVCLVSANRPIENEKSNALENLHAAVRFIEDREGRGAFVPYMDDRSSVVKIHRATRLVGGRSFSDQVSSVKNREYGRYNGDFEFVKNPEFSEKKDGRAPIEVSGLTAESAGILMLTPYPGIVYPEVGEGVRYLLLNTYHSGTLDTKSPAAVSFYEKMRAKGVRVFATGVAKGPEYESSTLYDELGITPIYNISPVAAYMKLWLLSSSGETAEEYLNIPLGGDM
ncbi:MAG: asparaginase [Ruminococcaceae bacterium]|nr:asparaginase [Oscillospiraceae bacterium]